MSTIGRVVCFVHIIIQMLISSRKYTNRHTDNNFWPNIWVSCVSIILTHKIDHHIELIIIYFFHFIFPELCIWNCSLALANVFLILQPFSLPSRNISLSETEGKAECRNFKIHYNLLFHLFLRTCQSIMIDNVYNQMNRVWINNINYVSQINLYCPSK